MTTKGVRMNKIRIILLIGFMALIAGCKDDSKEFAKFLRDFHEYTAPKRVNVVIEYGFWGKKLTFVFEDEFPPAPFIYSAY